MTSSEQRELRGQLLVDIEEAEANLAAIQEKATRYVADVREVLTMIEQADRDSRGIHAPTRQSQGETLAEEIRRTPKYGKQMNLEVALDVAAELKQARTNLDNLRKRKAALSLSVVA